MREALDLRGELGASGEMDFLGVRVTDDFRDGAGVDRFAP